jgi:hypothetical protein
LSRTDQQRQRLRQVVGFLGDGDIDISFAQAFQGPEIGHPDLSDNPAPCRFQTGLHKPVCLMQGGAIGDEKKQEGQNIDNQKARFDLQPQQGLFGSLINETDQTGIAKSRQTSKNKNHPATGGRPIPEQA